MSQLSSSVLGVLRLLTPQEVKRLSSGQGEVKKGAEVGQATVQSVGIQTNTQTEVDASAEHRAKLIPLHDGIEQEEEIDPYASKKSDQGEEQRPREEGFGNPGNNHKKQSKKLAPDPFVREGDIGLESVGIFSSEKMKKIEAEKTELEKNSSPSASVFLMTERDKFKKARNKLKNIEATKEYCDKQKKDSGSGSDPAVSSTGILLDKKLA